MKIFRRFGSAAIHFRTPLSVQKEAEDDCLLQRHSCASDREHDKGRSGWRADESLKRFDENIIDLIESEVCANAVHSLLFVDSSSTKLFEARSWKGCFLRGCYKRGVKVMAARCLVKAARGMLPIKVILSPYQTDIKNSSEFHRNFFRYCI